MLSRMAEKHQMRRSRADQEAHPLPTRPVQIEHQVPLVCSSMPNHTAVELTVNPLRHALTIAIYTTVVIRGLPYLPRNLRTTA